MNTKLLNIVPLDGDLVIKRGVADVGDGVTIKNQTKELPITENGEIEVLPDDGYTGLGKVVANVNVPLGLQQKTIKVTKTQSSYQSYVADEGYKGISKAIVEVDIPFVLEDAVENKTKFGTSTIYTATGYQGMSRVTIHHKILSHCAGFEVEVFYAGVKKETLLLSVPFGKTWEQLVNEYGNYDGLDRFALDATGETLLYVDKIGNAMPLEQREEDMVAPSKYVVRFPSSYVAVIGGVTYRSDADMLWNNWVASSYNTGGFSIDENGYVRLNDEYLVQENIRNAEDSKYVKSDMLFCHNRPYSFTDIIPAPDADKILVSGLDRIEINSAKVNSIESLKVSGGAEQNGTPVPTAPVHILTNKGALRYGNIGTNLLNVNTANLVLNKYLNNAGEETASAANFYVAQFIPVKAGVAYTASFSKAIGYFSYMEYDENFVFIKRTLVGGGTSASITSSTYIMGADTAYVVVGSNPTSAQVTADDVMAINWMFNEGETALPYEPYNAGLVLDGEDTVSVRSKNLNEGTLDHIGFTSTGGTSTSTTFCGTSCKIKVREGQIYTVSFGNFSEGASGVFVNTWKTDGSWNMRQAISSNGKLTYTIPEGVGYVNFTLYKTGGIVIEENSWMQVELGSEATDYVPYAFYGSAEAELLLSVGDYADTQNVINGEIVRKVGIKVFDGTERVSISSGTFNYGINDKLKSGVKILCTHYPFTSASASTAPDKTIKSYSSVNIGFKDSSFTTVAEFAEYLAQQYAKGTPVIVLYPLAEDTKETVQAQPLSNSNGNFIIARTAEIDGLSMEAILDNEPDIKFFVDNSAYKAKEGMTFEEWINSPYSPKDGKETFFVTTVGRVKATVIEDGVETSYGVASFGGKSSIDSSTIIESGIRFHKFS